MYFGSPAQEAIIEYNKCKDPKERSKIYKERIKYPFEKLAENVLNTFKFTYFDVPKKDVQTEVVSTMVEKMHMYKEGKGRAFSYFTIIAKNHLILKNNGNYKRWQKNQLISEMPQTWNPQNDYYQSQQNEEYSEFRQIMLDYWDKNLTVVFTKKRDIQIALDDGANGKGRCLRHGPSDQTLCRILYPGRCRTGGNVPARKLRR